MEGSMSKWNLAFEFEAGPDIDDALETLDTIVMSQILTIHGDRRVNSLQLDRYDDEGHKVGIGFTERTDRA